MPNFYGIEVSVETLEAYDRQDLGFKAQARQIISDMVGYTPPYQLSSRCELSIRDALKRFAHGHITRAELDNIISFQAHVMNTIMMEYAQAGTG